MAHTPGPWEFIPSSYYGYSTLWNPQTRQEIITTSGQNDGDHPITWMGEELQPADGYLIEAAPDLYAALNSIIRKTPFRPTAEGIALHLSFEQIKTCKAAIEKAERK